jgi:hypothetical protein
LILPEKGNAGHLPRMLGVFLALFDSIYPFWIIVPAARAGGLRLTSRVGKGRSRPLRWHRWTLGQARPIARLAPRFRRLVQGWSLDGCYSWALVHGWGWVHPIMGLWMDGKQAKQDDQQSGANDRDPSPVPINPIHEIERVHCRLGPWWSVGRARSPWCPRLARRVAALGCRGLRPR